MWWHFPIIILSIVVLSIGCLCCVVHCTRNNFYPEGTRGPKTVDLYRGLVDGKETNGNQLYITKEGEPSWGQENEYGMRVDQPTRVVEPWRYDKREQDNARGRAQAKVQAQSQAQTVKQAVRHNRV